MAEILILEDDAVLLETLADFLHQFGHKISAMYDGETALDAIYTKRYDLLILDVNVPKMNGFNVLKALREANIKTPAIFITSLNSLDDLETGYASGADDYLRKPFELKELHLRVEALLQRSFFHHKSNCIQLQNQMIFDIDKNSIFIGDDCIKLSPKETQLLKLLLKNRGSIVSNEEIYNELWDYETPSEMSLRAFIKNLRKILGKESIMSFKKIGYKFAN